MNGKFRNWTSIFLALALIVAVISILFIVFFTCRSSAIMEQAGEIGNLLSAGLGIIGIAIAVWAALNITNAISRAEIEKAGKTVSALEQKIDPIDKFVQKNKGVQKELFLQEINKHKDDPIIGYFDSQFNNSKKDDPYSELTIIELLFSRVKSRHRSEYAVDFTLLSLAKDGIDRIDRLERNRDYSEFAKNYLCYRKAGFNFYMGYCAESKSDGAKYFLTAVEKYKEFANYIGLSLDKRINSFAERDKSEEAAILYNSIGESYSKIVHYYNDDPEIRTKDIFQKNIAEYSSLAVAYLVKAVDCEERVNGRTRSTTYRNLGCAYERKDKQEGNFGGNKDNIILSYQKALARALDDSAASTVTIKNAYHALLSYYCKFITHTISRGKNEQFTDLKDLHLSINKTEDATIKVVIKEIPEMYDYARLAMQDFSGSQSIAQFYGAACCFAAMSKWDGVGPDSQLNGDQQFYIDEAKQFCKKYNLIFRLGSNANTAKKFNDTIDSLCNYIVK